MEDKLKEKGWSDEEVDQAMNIMYSKDKEHKRTMYKKSMNPLLYWAGLILAIIGNLFIGVVLVPLMLVLSSTILYIIIAVVGIATGRWVRTHRGSVNPSVTATPGGSQADAAVLDRELNAILTVATAADSVKLPLAKAGMVCHIVNKSANPCDVFPGSGDFLDVALVNVAASLAAAAKISYRAIDDATWVSF